jgi:hypothetical protein
LSDSALEKTFGFLAKAGGEAAVELLRVGLDVPRPAVRRCALRALLLRRRCARAVQEVLRLLPGLTDADAPVVCEQADRFGRMMGEVLRSGPPEQSETACQAVVKYRAYSAVPALVSGVNNVAEPRRGLFARTLLELADCFYAELRTLRSPQAREDREGLRCEIVEQLEQAVRKFHEHRRTEVVEAFFILATPKNACLRQILSDNRGKICQAIAAPLLSSSRGGILRLALALLEDPWPLPPADEIVSRREDLRFVELLLSSVGTRRWPAVRSTLRNVQSIVWAKPKHPLFTQLNGAQQTAAVSVMAAASMPREELFAVLEYLVVSGHPEGRVTAAQTLAAYREPEADALFAAWLTHEDPEVRAVAVGQVRPRRGDETVPLLIGMLDRREPRVLAAIREALPEFSFSRFLVRLKDMPPAVRSEVGRLVAKLAEDPAGELRKDLESDLSHVRVRAAQAVAAMGLAGQLEDALIAMLDEDPDKFVRAACAEALAQCSGAAARGALSAALADPDGTLPHAGEPRPSGMEPVEEQNAVAVAELPEDAPGALEDAVEENT